MKNGNRIRGVRCLIAAGAVLCLTGCSVSVGGYTLWGDDELTFVCAEEDAGAEGSGEEVRGADAFPGEERAETAGRSGAEQTRIAVPSEEQAEAAVSPDGEQAQTEAGVTSGGRVNLNTASLEELMTLNGIGETRAKAIIEHRTRNGPFTKEEEIMQIPGIKEGVYTKIQDQITVR